MQRFADEMSEHRQELVRLDTAIGDGDHGTNMNRGMQKALQKLQESDPADPAAVLKTAYHRLFKQLPKTPAMMLAESVDDQPAEPLPVLEEGE